MIRKALLGAGILSLAVGGFVPAFASNPGPNGHNNNGLCEAAGSGSQQGQAQKQANGAAFQALAAAGESQETSGDSEPDNAADIQQFCGSTFG